MAKWAILEWVWAMRVNSIGGMRPFINATGLGLQPGPYPSSWTDPNSNSITCLDWAPTQAQTRHQELGPGLQLKPKFKAKSKPKNSKFPHNPPLQPPLGHHHQNPLCPWAHRQPHRRLHRSPPSHHPLSRSAAHAHSHVPALVAKANGRTSLGQPRWH